MPARFVSTARYWARGSEDVAWHRRPEDWAPQLGGPPLAEPGAALPARALLDALRSGRAELRCFDAWFGTRPFAPQADWHTGGNPARTVVVRYDADPRRFAERFEGALELLGVAPPADAPRMTVVNRTRASDTESDALDAAALAYLREVYREDYELWECAEAAAGGTAQHPWMGLF